MISGSRPRYFAVVWLLLLVLGAFFLFAVASDLAADANTGIPNDHSPTFLSVARITWPYAQRVAPGVSRYVTLLEVGYAFHELVFAILYLVIVAIPFRQGRVWAWWACWAVEIANVSYALTFGAHDPAILYRALAAAIVVPLLLLATAPWFFARSRRGDMQEVADLTRSVER